MTVTDWRWCMLLAFSVVASDSCSDPVTTKGDSRGASIAASAVAPSPRAISEPTRLSHIFDDAAARELMRLRVQFDEAELAAIREFDSRIAPGQVRIAVPVHHYERQLATREVGEYPWTPEQKRRAAAAWPMRQKKIDEAEGALSVRTAAILRPFGFAEDRVPPIRHRKWDGPAVYGFNSFRGDVPDASRVLLQEVRRLWSLSGRLRP